MDELNIAMRVLELATRLWLDQHGVAATVKVKERIDPDETRKAD